MIDFKIPLQFGLWWSGTKLSYLRYLTFVSLRKYHKESKISLYIGDEYNNQGYTWGQEQQDFENPSNSQIDYICALDDLGVEVIHTDMFAKYASNYQSDFFRWWWIKENGGFYLDNDQIILKSFEDINRDYDFIYSEYQAPSCGTYTPVGVVGATKDSEVVSWINALLPQYYDPNSYNSLGPFMLRSIIRSRKWKDRMYNTPSNMFYPVPDSCMVGLLYDGKIDLHEGMKSVNGEIYSCHWFGGHPLSQKFNKKYTKEFAKSSNDSISRFLKKENLI